MLSLLWPHIRLNTIFTLYGFHCKVGEQIRPQWHHRSHEWSVHPIYVRDVCLCFLSTFLIMGPVMAAFSMPPDPFPTPNSICQAFSSPWCIMESNRVLQKQQLVEIRSMNSWPELEAFKPQSGLFLNLKAYSLQCCTQLISVSVYQQGGNSSRTYLLRVNVQTGWVRRLQGSH